VFCHETIHPQHVMANAFLLIVAKYHIITPARYQLIILEMYKHLLP